MMSKATKVGVAFSGGKDSTASILILRKMGYDVSAFTMKLGIGAEEERLARIRYLAEFIDVPLQIVDVSSEFEQKVIAYFLDSYRTGRTPNPCMVCNHHIKFKLLFDYVLTAGKNSLYATGHYADTSILEGRKLLREPKERRKSQIYFLSLIEPRVLSRVIFPLAGLTLAEVREMVRGLPLANLEESQDVCFLDNKPLPEFLHELMPDMFKPGEIVSVDGDRLGSHGGVVHFTVGQRRGTRISSGKRLYVIRVDTATNRIIVGDESHLMRPSLKVSRPVFWKTLSAGDRCLVKVRYLSRPASALIRESSTDSIQADFDEPVRAVTPGQFAVFYQEDMVVAAGHIDGSS